ncbi:MAG: DUF4153 domain-containing protein [Bacillota bacterium]
MSDQITEAPVAASAHQPPSAGGPMSPTTRLALLAVGCALLMGLLGDQLILSSPQLGLGGFLWVTALAGSALWLSRRAEQPLSGEARWLLAGAVLFAGGLIWRSTLPLMLLDLLAIAVCLGLAALTGRAGLLSRAGILSYPLGLALSAVHHALGPFLLLLGDLNWKEVPRGRWSNLAAGLFRGLLIAVPLLLLFGLLFMAADAVFARLVTNLFHLDLPGLVEDLFGALFFAFLAAGFLRTALLRKPEPLPELPDGALRIGPIETGVILGLLNLLFGAFVLVQVRYLFGGAELVLATVDLTYAEYARRGFFELVQVAALVLPVLLGLHWLLPAQGVEQRLFRWLGGSLVGLLFVIMASALQRMFLYQQEYGLTELRLYTTAFMGWMALLFLWFLATVLRGRRERFAPGALVSGLLVLASLHLLNPDGLIIRTNLALHERTGRFDAAYAASLGPDALPALLEALPRLDPASQEEVKRHLAERLDRLSDTDWRGWNWGRSQAWRAYQNTLPPQP